MLARPHGAIDDEVGRAFVEGRRDGDFGVERRGVERRGRRRGGGGGRRKAWELGEDWPVCRGGRKEE